MLWYIWNNENSPVYGKDRMTTFERYFVAAPETHVGAEESLLRLM